MRTGHLGDSGGQVWGFVEAAGDKFEDRDDLFAGYIEPLHDLLDGGPAGEVIEDDLDGLASSAKEPRAADFAGDAHDQD